MNIALSIRTKIILASIVTSLCVAVFIYAYYPQQQEQLAFEAIDEEIVSISNMFSIGVGIGMGEIDFVAVDEALSWAHKHGSVVYVSVIDLYRNPIASLNITGMQVPQQLEGLQENHFLVEEDRVLFYKRDIAYQKKVVGKLVIGYSLKNLDNRLKTLRTTTSYFCIALFTVGLVISVIIGNMISRNIMLMDRAVNAIAQGANSARVKVSSGDEVEKLANAFNSMLDKLDASRGDLINYSTQLKRQNEELNQFSYVVSHDLKAPLRAIFKLSEWIEEDLGKNLPADTQKNLQIMRGRVFRMEALINGLLDYSKIGRLDIVTEKTDTCQLIKEILDLHAPSERIKVTLSNDLPVLRTKKILLHQVFSNLISNAIKYNNKEQPLLYVDVVEHNTCYEFTVADNGIGIDKAYHEKVFGMFQKLEARDKVEGTGVGLAIVKKCVEDVGGKIFLTSEPGNGSSFTFTWPKNMEKLKAEQFEKV